jgi:hypothetical protein
MQANPVKLVNRIKKVQGDLTVLKDQCQELLAAKQVGIGDFLVLFFWVVNFGFFFFFEFEDPNEGIVMGFWSFDFSCCVFVGFD